MAEHQEDINNQATTRVIREKDEEIVENVDDTLKGAQRATEDEHGMGLREGIRKYPKAVFWSIWFSSALIMEGFDHAFIAGFFAFPAFQEHYGKLQKDGTYQVPATLQSAIGNGVNAGEIIGLLLNGILADYFGYRWVMIGCLVLMMAFIFLQFFATSIYMYLGAEILLGLPWGVFQTLTTTYAAEVCPTVLREYRLLAWNWCPACIPVIYWTVGVSHSLCASVDPANSSCDWYLPGPRVTLVVDPQGPDRRCRQGRSSTTVKG
jgi:SP family general alpha glucoside:H+ symporter-like MFS transporter